MNLGKLNEENLHNYKVALEYYQKAKPIYTKSHNGQYDAYFDGRIQFCKDKLEEEKKSKSHARIAQYQVYVPKVISVCNKCNKYLLRLCFVSFKN